MIHLSSPLSYSEGKRCPKKIFLNPSPSQLIKQDQYILFTPKNNSKHKKEILDKWLLDVNAIILEENNHTPSKSVKEALLNPDQTFSSNDNLQSDLNASIDHFKQRTNDDSLTLENHSVHHIPSSLDNITTATTTMNISQSLNIHRKYPHIIPQASHSYINSSLLSQRNTIKKKALIKTLPR